MPSKTSKKKPAVTLPTSPKELLDQFVSGPMSAEAIIDSFWRVPPTAKVTGVLPAGA